MNDNRTGGMMLVAGSAVGLITMGLHPMPHPGGLPPPQAMAAIALLDRVVHALGIAGLPLTFLGALALTRRLAGVNRLPLAALVVYGFAAVAIMIAASMSGFVSADIMSRMVEGDPKLESRRMLLDYTFRINQAFASVYTVGSSTAILLWSVAMLQTRLLSVGLGIYGLVLGSVSAAALLIGILPLNVHGFGLVVLTQSIWFIGVGSLLMRSTDTKDHQEQSTGPGAGAIPAGASR